MEQGGNKNESRRSLFGRRIHQSEPPRRSTTHRPLRTEKLQSFVAVSFIESANVGEHVTGPTLRNASTSNQNK